MQKSLHLIGYCTQLNLGNEYIRNTAGPDDQQLMNHIDQFAKDYIIKAKVKKSAPVSKKRIKELKEEMENLNYIFRKKRITQVAYDKEYDELEKELKEIKLREADDMLEGIYIVTDACADWSYGTEEEFLSKSLLIARTKKYCIQ